MRHPSPVPPVTWPTAQGPAHRLESSKRSSDDITLSRMLSSCSAQRCAGRPVSRRARTKPRSAPYRSDPQTVAAERWMMPCHSADAWPSPNTAQLKLQALGPRTVSPAATAPGRQMSIPALWHRSDGYRSRERVQRLDLGCADHMSRRRRPARPRKLDEQGGPQAHVPVLEGPYLERGFR